jgi:hypothetical protein
MSGTTAVAVSAFVALESNKDVIFKYVYLVGCGNAVFCLAMFGLLSVMPGTIMFMVSAIGTASAGGIGWYCALNKKDDLNMMRAVAKFKEQLGRMKEAEAKLSSALATMTVSGKKMDELEAEIKTEQDATESTIKSIQKINGEAMSQDKRAAHERILCNLADMDGNRTFGADECHRLLRLLCNMSGKDPDDPLIIAFRAKLTPLSHNTILTSKQMNGLLNEIDAFDIIMEPPADDFVKFGFESREVFKKGAIASAGESSAALVPAVEE